MQQISEEIKQKIGKIDRDVNGSRNILLKCVGELTSKLGMIT